MTTPLPEHDLHDYSLNDLHADVVTNVTSNDDSNTKIDGNESNTSLASTVSQALDSNEVIELQAFIERKAWIEEKIKVLSCSQV